MVGDPRRRRRDGADGDHRREPLGEPGGLRQAPRVGMQPADVDQLEQASRSRAHPQRLVSTGGALDVHDLVGDALMTAVDDEPEHRTEVGADDAARLDDLDGRGDRRGILERGDLHAPHPHRRSWPIRPRFGGTMDVVTESDRPSARAMPRVLGPVVDEMTRCVHYRTEVDIVAIKFACCNEYYPCHRCHEETADHPAAAVGARGARRGGRALRRLRQRAHHRHVPRDPRMPELRVGVQRGLPAAHAPLFRDGRLSDR